MKILLTTAADRGNARAGARARPPNRRQAGRQAGSQDRHPRRRKLARSAQKAVEEATPVDDDPAVTLTTGRPRGRQDACSSATSRANSAPASTSRRTSAKASSMCRAGIQRFRMHPVESRTGAIRLEDPRAGAMWLQLGNKSMLMSQKHGPAPGRRMPGRRRRSRWPRTLKKNPPKSLFEAAAGRPPRRSIAGQGAALASSRSRPTPILLIQRRKERCCKPTLTMSPNAPRSASRRCRCRPSRPPT